MSDSRERIADNRFNRSVFIGRGLKKIGAAVVIIGGGGGAALVGKSFVELTANIDPTRDETKEDTREMAKGVGLASVSALGGAGIYRIGEIIEERAGDRQK